jgi:hypothetical protein
MLAAILCLHPSSTTTLAILGAYRSRAASQTRRSCGLGVNKARQAAPAFRTFWLSIVPLRMPCAPARTASAIFVPAGRPLYQPDEASLEGSVLIRNEQFLAGKKL